MNIKEMKNLRNVNPTSFPLYNDDIYNIISKNKKSIVLGEKNGKIQAHGWTKLRDKNETSPALRGTPF